jgi:hypothetical protein
VRATRTAACIGIACLAPFILSAVSVAAGHVLWSHVEQPSLVAAYCNYRIDRVILLANAGICVGVVAVSVWRLPLRRRLVTTLAPIAATASLPAYVLAYLYAFEVASWLGVGWSSSL